MTKLSQERKIQITPTIIKNYQEGKKVKHISNELGISTECIRRVLQKADVYTPYERTWTNAQRKQAVKDYNNGIEITTIARNLNISPMTITYHLQKNNKWEYKGTRKYTFNERFFQTIDTEEKAYWLGFIAADGSVYRSTLHIGLQGDEAHHLKKFKKHIQAEHPVKVNDYKSKGKMLKLARIDLYSFKTIKDLIRLGIYANKTKTMSWDDVTQHVPARMMQHFVRGFFDGDGCWTHSRHKYPKFALTCASSNFIHPLAEWVSDKIKAPVRCYVHKTSGAWMFCFCGKGKCQPLYDALYKNATILLKRKQDRALQFLLTHSP